MRDLYMFLRLFIILQLFLPTTIFSSDFIDKVPQRSRIIPMKTSVIVPCCGKHFHHLFPLLVEYTKQTCFPDEMVISLSDCHMLRKNDIDMLEKQPWPFRIKIIQHERKKTAAENRNIGCEYASGDVILCQDADDLPHPQRVEIVKFLFEKYQIDHLMHFFADPGSTFVNYKKDTLQLIKYKCAHMATRLPYVHNGNICLSKTLANKVKWPLMDAEDMLFNISVYSQFATTAVLQVPLIIYRNYLSSLPYVKEENK